MPAAQIKINGSDARFATVPIGVAVNLSNHDAGGETTYTWSIVDQPEGTGDSLSSTSVRDVAFTPTKEGSYEIQLTVNSLLVQTAVVAVLDARTHERVPAATETVEAGSSQGWALAVKRILNRTLHASVDANLVVAVSPGSISAGTIVSLTGVSTINSGTQASFQAPGIVAALGTAAHSNKLGVLIDGVVPGSIGAGALVLVRMFGLVPTSATGSPSVGATVFLSNTATPALTPGTVSRAIGYVVAASGGTYQWVIDGGVDAELAVAALPGLTAFTTMAAASIKANITGSPATGTDATPAQIRALLGGNLLGIQTFVANGTTAYNPAAGTKRIEYEMVACGGGGGGVATNGGAAGGNSGFYCRGTLTNAAGIAAGSITGSSTGGAGGANTGANGSTGADAVFVVDGKTITMKGGTGGTGVNNSTSVNFGIPLAPQAGSTPIGTNGVYVLRYGPGEPGDSTGATGLSAGGEGGESLLGTPGSPQGPAVGTGNAGTFGGGGGGAGPQSFSSVGGAGGGFMLIVHEYS